MQKLSQTDLPVISAPASSSRVTTVASVSGTNPSSTFEPFIIERPATQTLSLMTIFLPANGPLGAPLMDAVTYQAPSGFSAADGRIDVRGPYFGGGAGGRALDTRSAVFTKSAAYAWIAFNSASESSTPTACASRRTSSRVVWPSELQP